MISLAFWISLTRYVFYKLLLIFSNVLFSQRISDYYHHPYDVVTGALVGIVFASSTLLVMADVFNKRCQWLTNMTHLGWSAGLHSGSPSSLCLRKTVETLESWTFHTLTNQSLALRWTIYFSFVWISALHFLQAAVKSRVVFWQRTDSAHPLLIRPR